VLSPYELAHIRDLEAMVAQVHVDVEVIENHASEYRRVAIVFEEVRSMLCTEPSFKFLDEPQPVGCLSCGYRDWRLRKEQPVFFGWADK
jgi:hypothetical protein